MSDMRRYSFTISYGATVYEEAIIEAPDFASAQIVIARNGYKPTTTEILEKYEDTIEISSRGEACEEPPKLVLVDLPARNAPD